MSGDADADSGEMVVIGVNKIGILRKNDGKLAGDVLVDKRLGGGRNKSVLRDSGFALWYEGENFARGEIAVFEAH